MITILRTLGIIAFILAVVVAYANKDHGGSE